MSIFDVLVFVLLQFQTELRKILVSLIEVAQKLLALNPDAVELFKKANGESYKPLQVDANNPPSRNMIEYVV